MQLLSRLDFYEIGRRYLLARARRIDPDRVDVEGSDANLFVGSMSFVAAALSRQLADRISALFLSGAQKEDLDRYAFDRYQLVRKGAAPAKVVLRTWRATAAKGQGEVPVGTVVLSLGGIEYVTTTGTTFTASGLTALPFEARAIQAGKDYQVGANQIRRFAKSAQLFDPTLEVNNDAPAAGGENAEEDDDFRERVRDFWNTARRGTISAIEFGARAVPGVASASAVETLSPTTNQPARVVNLFVADSSGVASAPMAREVETSLLEYRAAGIAVVISTSIPQIVNVTLRLAFAAGIDTATLTETIRTAVFEFINSLPVNATLLRASLFALLQRYKGEGLIVGEGTIVEPTGDLVPSPGQTLRTRLENVRVA